jgi:hypothetical protein
MAITGTASAYKCCAEGVNEYHGYLPDLSHNIENAEGFYTELGSDASWSGCFIAGDDAAWENHWKDPVYNGHDDEWVDNTRFAFFSGHGSSSGFYFGTTHDDHQLHYSDALWGNTGMDWIAIDACEVLKDENVANWLSAFERLHSICGFNTTCHDESDRGSRFAKRMDGTWAEWTIIQAWVQAAKDTEGPDTYVAALAADVDGSTSTYDCWEDHIYGHGSQINPLADPPFWWYCSYQC